MRTFHPLWAVFLVTALCGNAAGTVPWPSGESLTYEIHWGMVKAADARFLAKQKDHLWQLTLDMESKGLVDDLHPFQIGFESTTQTDPWRTLRFVQDRREGRDEEKNWKRLKQFQIDFDYTARSGHFTDDNDGRDIRFELVHQQIDDLLSMLYGLRSRDWIQSSRYTFMVANRYKDPIQAEAFLVERLTDSVAGYPKQKLFVVQAQRVFDQSVKNKEAVWTRVWVTDDERKLPLMARLKMKFGTFTIRLVHHGIE